MHAESIRLLLEQREKTCAILVCRIRVRRMEQRPDELAFGFILQLISITLAGTRSGVVFAIGPCVGGTVGRKV